MFETVAPEAFQTRSRRVFIETLPISIAVHVLGVGAAMASMIWNVAFPTQSPRLTVAYSLTQVPDPPPPPPPPRAATASKPAALQPKMPPPTIPVQIVAPTVIPDLIPEVVAPQPALPPAVAVPAPVTPIAPAVASGPEPGMTGGKPGGSGRALGVTGGITFGDDGRVYVDRAVKLPLREVIHDYPHYPEKARKTRLEGTCVVRYTIGKNGRIVDIAILDHAKDPMFDEETLNTVRGWVYRPMVVEGKPVEVVHELEVNYQFIVR